VALARTGNKTAKARGEYNEITREAWLALLSFYGMNCINPNCNKESGKYGNISRDHILPLALGGKHVISNLQPLCLRCNIKKGVTHIDYRWDKGVEFMKTIKENHGGSAI
jgi:5-methylcytosine-specific restriction endonuclease McrA